MWLEWNVFFEDVNAKQIIKFNIFNHRDFCESVEKILKMKISRADFAKRIERELMYYFWSKSEYEIVLTSWPPYISEDERNRVNQEAALRESKGWDNHIHDVNLTVRKKVDIYEQIMLNFEKFIDYLRKVD